MFQVATCQPAENTIPTDIDAGDVSSFVDVLTSSTDGTPFGYFLKGGFSGPTVAVLGFGPGATDAFDRLLRIGSLRWMRGSLVLLRADAGLNPLTEIASHTDIGPIDRSMVLPWAKTARANPDLWSHAPILRFCTALGMIQGRGVPPAPTSVVADAQAPRLI